MKRIRPMVWLAFGVLLASAALGVACTRRTPAARDEIRFAHGSHIRAELACQDCHRAAVADGEMMPPEEQCRECHDEPEAQRCEFCHTAPQAAASYAPREHRIRFDHQREQHARDGNCVGCHASSGGDESLDAFEPAIPTMQTCLGSCHEAEMVQLECMGCHLDLSDYELTDLEMVRHAPSFARQHGPEARADSSLCTQCHEPTFCSDCHIASPGLSLELLEPTQAYRDFVHRGDFRARHAMEARLDRGTCARCHGVSYCDGCHQESGIGGSVAPGSPHPPGWLDPVSPNSHAREARRNLMTCASCHESDAEQTCVPCHRVGGVAGNPHPPGFDRGLDPLEHGLCRACHSP